MLRTILRLSSGDKTIRRAQKTSVVGSDAQAYNIQGLPVDVLEHVFRFLEAREVVALSCACRLLRDVAMSPRVWAELAQRSFSLEELPQDLEFLNSRSADVIRTQFWQVVRQRPAFLSDASRTSEILEHAGSRFRKVLHVDGRRDFNFTTVFRDVPPGQYVVVWRLMLQPGYVRGYCNFRAVFSRPADPKAAAAITAATRMQAGPSSSPAARSGPQTWRVRRRLRWLPPCMSPAGAPAGRADDSDVGSGNDRSSSAGGSRQPTAPAPLVVAPERLAEAPLQPPSAASASLPPHGPGNQQVPQQHPQLLQPQPQPQAAVAVQALVPEIEPEVPLPPPQPAPVAPLPIANTPAQPQLPPQAQQQQRHHHHPLQRLSAVQRAAAGTGPQVQLHRAMGQLATVSAKRDAALAGAGGPRYVPRWLSPLWGSHACAWRQLDPAGPLGHGAWRSLHMGTLTLRRRADAHLHGVMVQLRPLNAAQMELALPLGETRWRGALVDYVELVPVRSGKLLGGLLPGFRQRGGSLQRASSVFPEMNEMVEVPRL